MEYLILILFLLLLFIFFIPSRHIKEKRPKSRIFGYRVFYGDDKRYKNNGLLKSEKYMLRGKPDFIFKSLFFSKYIVVELKSGKSDEIKENDLMQLVAYFLMVEDIYKRPKEGRLIYSNTMFVIKNTKKLRKRLIKTMDDMDEMLETGEGEANCSFQTCKYCLAKFVCERNE